MADPALSIPRMSATEYLQMEKQATRKHEFVNGIVYAMAGASRRHNIITNNVYGAISAGLSPPCQAFNLDVKVHNKGASEEQYYYPDVVVTCSDLDNDEYLIRQPSLIVEVLSPSTQDADRGYKFDHYRLSPSLQEYLLVHQERPRAELFRRRTEWTKEVYELNDEITFESVGLTAPVAAFYKRVTF